MFDHSQDNTIMPRWQFDEKYHAGVDYANHEVAETYDEHHGKFRDFEKDAQLVMSRLDLTPEARLIDLGCGTGAYAIPFSQQYKKVYAVDISQAMLSCCERKKKLLGIENIETHCGGFLSYNHRDDPVDAIVSSVALHHIPDFWKAIAIQRMHSMLKPGGKLYLFDVIFSFQPQNYCDAINAWIEVMRKDADEQIAENANTHIRNEFSTFSWIIEGMLERADFRILNCFQETSLLSTYVCVKV